MKCWHLNGFLSRKGFDVRVLRIAPIRRIEARLEDWHWEWSAKNTQAIARYWDQLCAANTHVYDGTVLLMHDGAVEGDVYKSGYFPARYSHFLALRDWGHPDKSVRNGFSCAALKTADEAYVLGVMAAHTSNAGMIYFPAGTPDMNDCQGERVDIIGSAARELLEETGFGPPDICFEDRITLVEEELRVAFLCHATMTCTAQTAVDRFARWQAQLRHPELAALHVVRSKADLIPGRMHPYLLEWFETVLQS